MAFLGCDWKDFFFQAKQVINKQCNTLKKIQEKMLQLFGENRSRNIGRIFCENASAQKTKTII